MCKVRIEVLCVAVDGDFACKMRSVEVVEVSMRSKADMICKQYGGLKLGGGVHTRLDLFALDVRWRTDFAEVR